MAQASAQTPAIAQPVAKAQAEEPRRFRWQHALIYVMLAIFTISALGPFIISFFSSFKTFQDVLAFPPTLFPPHWTLANYAEVLGTGTFPLWILNSVIVAVAVVVLNLLVSSMAGYALSRMNFPGKNIIFIITLAVMMIPAPITIIPKFLTVNSLGLVNTFFALIIPAMAQPFSVFLMVQFMKVLPKELEESAYIDGASRWVTFTRVILPLVKPALTAVAILSFQGSWNDFLWPLLVLDSQNKYTLPLGLFYFKNAHYTQYNLLIAGSMFNIIPVLILFFIFQRYFMEGALGSAVKG